MLALSACSSDPWTQEEKNILLDQCDAEGGKKSYCNCYLEKAMEKYPIYADFESRSFEQGVEIAVECEEK